MTDSTKEDFRAILGEFNHILTVGSRAMKHIAFLSCLLK